MSLFDKRSRVPPGSGRLVPIDTRQEAAERFGARAQTVQIVTIDLSTAQTLKELKMTGNTVWALDATSNAAALTVRFNEQSGQGVTFKKGMFLKGINFDRVFVTNTAQSGATITLLVAVEGDQLIAIENAAETLSSVNLVKASSADSVADVSITATSTVLVAAAASTRHELLITNLAANTQTMRIGDSGAGATNGIPLAPGQTLILSTSAAIYAYNPGASAETLAVMELLD